LRDPEAPFPALHPIKDHKAKTTFLNDIWDPKAKSKFVHDISEDLSAARQEQLEKKHREILKDAEERFATLSSVKDLKEQFTDMKEKIDKIYDCIISVK